MPKLTAAFIQNAKPDPSKRLEIPDTIVVGLYAIIQPSGRKSWGCRYRHAGRTRKLTLGSYPAVSVAVARELAREALEEVARGIDPAAAKARGKAKTFAASPSYSSITTRRRTSRVGVIPINSCVSTPSRRGATANSPRSAAPT